MHINFFLEMFERSQKLEFYCLFLNFQKSPDYFVPRTIESLSRKISECCNTSSTATYYFQNKQLSKRFFCLSIEKTANERVPFSKKHRFLADIDEFYTDG